MKKHLFQTLNFCNRFHREAMNLMQENENPMDYSSQGKSLWRRILYFWLMVYRGFTKSRCFVRSSALSYATILALVPILALVISISASLLKTQSGEQQIVEFTNKAISFLVPQLNLLGKEEVMQESFSEDQLDQNKVAQYINSLVSNVRGGALGVTGFVSLIAVAILLLTKVEDAFNDIWRVTRPRGWSMRILSYWGVISLGPLLIFVALSLFGTAKIGYLQKIFGIIPGVGDLFYKEVLLRGLPWALMIVGFTLLYYFMPSTQVNWSSALLGGTFTGVLWQFNSMYSIIYASSVVSYSKMYGFLAAIPILLLGLYLSWMLVLMGCQVSFTWQNRKFYVQHKFTKTIGQKDKELAALRIMTAMGKRFDRGETPYTVKELGDALFLPGSLVQEVLRQFVNTGLAVQSDHEQFLPCLPLDKLSCHRILSAFCQGRNELSQSSTPGAQAAVEVYRAIQATVQEASEKITIRDILRKEDDLKK